MQKMLFFFLNWSKVVLRIGPSMLCNITGSVLNVFFWSFVFVYIYIIPLHTGWRMSLKSKNTKKELRDQLLTQKRAYLGPALNSTAHIYIYAGELVLVPLFSLSRVRNSTTSRVRNSTTS